MLGQLGSGVRPQRFCLQRFLAEDVRNQALITRLVFAHHHYGVRHAGAAVRDGRRQTGVSMYPGP